MKINAYGVRLDVNTRQTKQWPVRRHYVVLKQLIYEAVNRSDQAMDICSLMVVR